MRSSFFGVVALLAGLHTASAATIFEFDSGAAGWTAGGCASAEDSPPGYFQLTLCAGAVAVSPPLTIDAEALRTLEVTAAGPYTGTVDVRFTTVTGTHTLRNALRLAGGGNVTTATAAVGAHPEWIGTVTGLSLSFPEDSGGALQLFRVAILRSPWRGAWRFEADDALGWTANETLTNATVADGSLSAQISLTSATKPRLQSPPGLRLSSRAFRTLFVTLRATSTTTSHKLRVWWGTTTSPTLNLSRSTTADLVADGSTQTLRIDLAEHAKWRDDVETLWVQPFDEPEDGATVEIESIAFAARAELEASTGRVGIDGSLPGLRVSDGALRGTVTDTPAMPISFRMEGPLDPFATLAIRATLGAGAGCELGLAFRTADSDALHTLPVVATCDSQPHDLLVDASAHAAWTGDLRELVVTLPGATGGRRDVAIHHVRLLPPGPSVELVRFAPEAPASVGVPLTVEIEVQNLGGGASQGGKIILAGTFAVLPSLAPYETFQASLTVPAALTCDQPGKQSLTATAQLPGFDGLYSWPSTRTVDWLNPLAALPPDVPPPGAGGSGVALPGVVFIQNSEVRLALHEDSCLGGYGYLRLFVADGAAWHPVGGRIGLGRMVAMAAGKPQDQRLTAPTAEPLVSGAGSLTLPLSQIWTDADGVQWEVAWTFTASAAGPWIEFTSTATASAERDILLFAGPGLEVGFGTGLAPELSGGLLGGLELLVPGEPSSSGRALSGADELRATPDVRLVGAGVMAAVTPDGRMGGVLWGPLDQWFASQARPSVRYELPNVDDGRPTHLLEPRVPNAPTNLAAGEDLASTPVTIAAGQALTLTGALFAAATSSADAAMRAVYRRKGVPTASTVVQFEARDRVRAALTTGGWTDGAGWTAAEGQPPAPHPDVLLVSRRLGEVDGDPALVGRAADAAALLSTPGEWAGGTGLWPTLDALWHDGPTTDALEHAWVALQGELTADPFAATPAELLGDALGPPNSQLGLAERAWRATRFARVTGHTAAIATSLELLTALDGVTIPRGGLTAADVPAAAPDLRFATNAILAYLEAYELTDDVDRLYDSLRWAYLALLFVRRHDGLNQPSGFARYGAVPAFGGRGYTESLLGQLSATEGPRLALALLQLSALDNSIAWKEVARGLVNGVLIRSRGDEDPMVGHTDELWDVRRKSASGGLRLPHLLARALLWLGGAPLRISTASTGTPAGSSAIVSTGAELGEVTFQAAGYTVDAEVSPLEVGQGATVTFGALLAKPPGVTVDGDTVPELATLEGATPGWAWSEALLLVAVRTGPLQGAVTVAVQFPIPDADEDGFPANLDCDDGDPKVHPDGVEICNGIDDDCDKSIDEPEDTGFLECGIGECAHAEAACVGGEAAVCDPFAGASDEICDELDNDCDGETDEDVGTVQCGVGICEHTIDACAECDPLLGAEPEVCDTVDNDCDGEVDETPGTVICGTGVCEHVVSVCEKDTCDTLLGAGLEVCDLLDNDCDGETDEGLPTVPCGTGECLHDIPACAPCDATEGAQAEACDFLDNDCDGETDEDTPTKPCGVGICASAVPACHDCDPQEGAQPEVCNELDDDCDGEVDNVEETKPCGTGQCFQEILACATCDPGAGAIEEVCDGLDNDCDGETDEITGTAVCGLGACAHDVPGCGVCEPFEGASDETCNGVDDDCDGAADELSDLGTFVCGTGACLHELPACTGGAETPCDPLAGAEPVETCDGVDNDCDGVTDEDIGIYTCGEGACAHDVVGCTLEGPGSCNPFLGAASEVCNGIDDDCNGDVDEGLGTVSCGGSLGCLKELPACADGEPIECDAITGLAPELCNGIDEDCDGLTDEDQLSLTCGIGICVHSVPGCKDGAPNTCDPTEGAVAETCNFVDDDCDGETDESAPPTTCGKGICEVTVDGCTNGAPTPCVPLDLAKPDVCNGEDDDCDGDTDENQGEKTCGIGSCQKTIALCVNGVVQGCDPDTGSAPEACNGEDDDCDGETDEELGTFVCGTGACERPLPNCSGGAETACDPYEGLTPEICNAVDDDCDGDTDENLGDLSCPQDDGSIVDIPACQQGVPVTCETGSVPSEDSGGGTGGDSTSGTTGGTTSGDTSKGPPISAPAPEGGCQAGHSRGTELLWLLLITLLLAANALRRPDGISSRRR